LGMEKIVTGEFRMFDSNGRARRFALMNGLYWI
jgi:hypothetical protein